jgi:hypothetical protein
MSNLTHPMMTPPMKLLLDQSVGYEAEAMQPAFMP